MIDLDTFDPLTGRPVKREVFSCEDMRGVYGIVVQPNSDRTNLEVFAWVRADRTPISKEDIPEAVRSSLTEKALASRERILAAALEADKLPGRPARGEAA